MTHRIKSCTLLLLIGASSARAARTEGDRTREQINNVVQTMHNKDNRDSTWQGRQDDNWRRLQNDMRDRDRVQQHPAPHMPPPYNPNWPG